MKLRTALLILLPALIWMGCDDKRIFETNVDMENKSWVADSIPSFEFKITDPQKKYNFYYNVRNTNAYPYHNLYVTYYLENDKGEVISTNLHNLELFDPKTGKPTGSGLGDIYDHQIKALSDYRFPSAGSYTFKVQQFMRMEALPEVLSVGIRVEESESRQ